MKRYRIRIEVDIDAHDPEHADRRARVLCSLLGQRYWVRDVLPDAVEERPAILLPGTDD